jgi:hypothetical protein
VSPQQFTSWAEAVFGKYLPAMKLEVEKWLGSRDCYFAAAMREIALREHPSIYGKPPGVHELEVWKIEAYQRGHTLEAIAAANKNTTLIAAEIDESYMSAEEAARKMAELREHLEKGGAA